MQYKIQIYFFEEASFESALAIRSSTPLIVRVTGTDIMHGAGTVRPMTVGLSDKGLRGDSPSGFPDQAATVTVSLLGSSHGSCCTCGYCSSNSYSSTCAS